jgi:hypothetical protein
MKRYNVSVPHPYEKDGEKKTAWKGVGTLVRFDATQDKPEGFILELNMFPGVKFGVFEQRDRDDKSKGDGDDF